MQKRTRHRTIDVNVQWGNGQGRGGGGEEEEVEMESSANVFTLVIRGYGVMNGVEELRRKQTVHSHRPTMFDPDLTHITFMVSALHLQSRKRKITHRYECLS